MRSRSIPLSLILGLLAAAPAWADFTCDGFNRIYWYSASGSSPATNNCFGGSGFRCYPPKGGSPTVELTDPSCNPQVQPCTVRLRVSLEFPGASQTWQEDSLAVGQIYWFSGATSPACNGSSTSCGQIGICSAAGQSLIYDFAETYILKNNVTCANAAASQEVFSLTAWSCVTSCRQELKVEGLVLGGPSLAAAIGCPMPPPDDCDTCTGCVLNGGGGPSGCSAPARGGGLACSPGGAGPGAHLRYRAGGAGATGLPGTSGWRPSLGLYWSHEHAQRIVTAPDLNHVWLVTERASFREFSNLAAGSGLRLYQTHAPSDEYRKLYYDSATGGWQLDSLDGRKEVFRSDGLWERTVYAQNPAHPTLATYNAGNQLTAVSFPDGRSETFTYQASGKLASITEVPVAGSGTPPRTWSYTWSGDVLTNIGRPDGTSWELTYDPARNGGRAGYLTQMRLIGTDGVTGRVEVAYEYDSFGNVTRSWSGDPVYTGPNAVNRQEFTYTNPQFPTRTQVKEWLDATQSETTVYDFGRDPASVKARITRISGDCPTCGLGPNSQMTYADGANPLRPTQRIDGRGLVTQYAYDANGMMTSKTEAAGTPLARTTTHQYSNASFPAFPTRVEAPSTSGGGALRVTVLAYDTSGNLTTRTIQGAEAGSSFSYATASAYNAAGQPLTVDPPGYTTSDQTSYTYDPARGDLLPLSRTDPLAGATAFGYDGLNRRTSVTDPNGVQTVTTYDNLGRITSVTQKGATSAGDLTTAYVYSLFGDLFRTILPRGNLLEYGYDAAGRLISVERKPDTATHGERTFYTLDTYGHRIKEELQRWNGTGWTTDSFTDSVYSSRCHLDRTAHPGGAVTEYAYDCDGNLEKVWDANHPKATNPNPTQLYAYDSLNRLSSLTQPWTGAGGGNAVTSYGYDVQDHLTGVTDAEGNATSYTYGDRDLMTAQVSPVSGTTSYAYNEHGELTSEIDARGIAMSRTVDALDRVTAVGYPDPSLGIAYTYDDPLVPFAKGRLTSIARNGTNVDYRYDRFGRLLQDGALSYGYDVNGNPVSLVYPGGVEAVTTYDYADRPATLLARRSGKPDQALVNAAGYLPSGPLSSLTLGNGLTETRAFTQRYFPSSITLSGLLGWTYTTDGVGNILSIADTLNAANNRTYGYQDNHYFLTQGNGPWGQRSWTYDKIGNRLTETRGATTDTYSYTSNGAAGRTPILSQIQLGAGGTRTYQFGPAGHLEQISVGADATVFRNDAASRLSAIERATPQAGVSFRYDGRDYLIRADAEALPFLDGFESGNVCGWTAALGVASPPVCTTPAPPTVQPTYSSAGLLHALTRNAAPQSSSIFYFAGRPVAQLDISSGTENWKLLTTDHLGTPIAATSSAGALLWQGGFEPFGADWNGAAGAGVFLRFPGQWEEGAWGNVGAGVHYNVHRWYEAGAGRYTSRDLLTWKSLPHLYLYALENPLLYTDPLGLEPVHNGSGVPVPYKPETGRPGQIWLCLPGQTCNADGVYPPACNGYPIKIVNGCAAEIDTDGRLVIRCPYIDLSARSFWESFSAAGQLVIGGRTGAGFYEAHRDWRLPNGKRYCGCDPTRPFNNPPPDIPSPPLP